MVRRSLLSWLIPGLLLIGQPCWATQVVIALGKTAATNPTAGVLSLTTVADCPVGSFVGVYNVTKNATLDFTSLSDSASNTYALIAGSAGTTTGVSSEWGDAQGTANDLPLGGTITGHYSGSTNAETIEAVCVTGSATSGAIDADPTPVTGSGTVNSIASGALTQANETVLVGVGAPTTTGSVTCGGSLTKSETSATAPSGTQCTQVVASASSFTATPSWVNTEAYILSMITVKTPSVSGDPAAAGLLLGEP